MSTDTLRLDVGLTDDDGNAKVYFLLGDVAEADAWLPLDVVVALQSVLATHAEVAEAPRPDMGPVSPGTLSVVAAATTARSREFAVEFEPDNDASHVDTILALNRAEQGSAWAHAEVARQDAELTALAARLSEVEAERDALQRQRDEVWHRIDLWSDDPDTGLDHLLDVWASHEKALAERDAARIQRDNAMKQRDQAFENAGYWHARLEAQDAAWRPVVEAAIAYRDARYTAQAGAAGDHLVAAVNALPTRNLDSTTPGDTDGD